MKIQSLIIASCVMALATACSTTKSIPEGDQLFTGLKAIEYDAPEKGEHFTTTQEEIGAALATAPTARFLAAAVCARRCRWDYGCGTSLSIAKVLWGNGCSDPLAPSPCS